MPREVSEGPSVVHAALFGLCPRCGAGKLFDGYLSIAKRCTHCGLDYAIFDSGDGPAVFGILIVGAVVCAGALWVEFTFHPPFWVHAALWLPITAILSLAFLRLAKSLLLVLQYKHKAGEGRLEG